MDVFYLNIIIQSIVQQSRTQILTQQPVQKLQKNYIIYKNKLSQRKQKMGNLCNICAGKHEKQQTNETVDTFNRNFILHSYVIKKMIYIDLVIGTYHCHKSETLLAIVQRQYLDYCTELRDYGNDIQQTMSQLLAQQSKLLTTVPLNKQCHYKKLQVCILPAYPGTQNQKQEYLQTFESVCEQIVYNCTDLTIQLTHTSQNSNGIPNQILMSIFMKVLAEYEDKCKIQNKEQKLRISVIANDTKLLNLVRFQVIKLENVEVNKYKNQIEKGFYGSR